jgi:uncharacterized membrane protein
VNAGLQTVLKWLLGLLFLAAGVNHFVRPDFYLRIMPPYLPYHVLLVYISGLAEMALAILLLIPRFQNAAAWGLIGLLLAVFPANLHMAMNSDQFPEFHPALLWIRLPLQVVLIIWAYSFTGRKRRQ